MIMKKTLFAFALGGCLTLSTLVGVSMFSNTNVFANPENQSNNSYLIKFNSKKNLPMFNENGNVDFVTENNNAVTFGISNLDKVADNWAQFTCSKQNTNNKTSYFSNTDWLKGITSIVITAQDDAVLTLSYKNQSSSDWIASMEHSFYDETDPDKYSTYEFNFDTIFPNYFKIENKEPSTNAIVKEIEIRMACTNYHPTISCYYDSLAGNVTGLGEYNIGEKVEVKAIPNLGYRFLGFYTKDDKLIQGNDTMIINVDGSFDNFNMDAKFEKINCNVGDKIYFGQYPQSKVNDPALIEKLNALVVDNPTLDSPGLWKEDNYYVNNMIVDYHWHIDRELDNQKYRCVYFTNYRPQLITSEYPIEGANDNFQFINGYKINTRYWFKFESVEWTYVNNNYALMATKILDSSHFDSDDNSNYETSDINSYINRKMMNNLFNDNEKGTIDTTYFGFNTPTSGVDTKGELSEKLLLADKADIDALNGMINLRKVKGTDYAKCLGLEVDENGYAAYWLRTDTMPGENHKVNENMFVTSLGETDPMVGGYVKTSSIGIRPMFTPTLPL